MAKSKTYMNRKKNIDKILEVVKDLKVLHEGAASIEHAIKKPEWRSYSPTRFLYSFFAFNALYSVNWGTSMNLGKLYYYKGRDFTESYKFGKYLDFCFEDSNFVDIYSEFFYNYVITNFRVDTILNELNKIKLDNKFTGNIYDEDFILDFQKACEDCLKGRNFNKENCQVIVNFIYKIRCNIFHGVKTLAVLDDPSQQKRIEIYTDIIIAVNQMLFSYLLYLNEGESFSDSFSELYDQLSVRQYGQLDFHI